MNEGKERKTCFIRRIMIFIAILFLGIGIWRGEAGVVWIKAVNLCLECIGIG